MRQKGFAPILILLIIVILIGVLIVAFKSISLDSFEQLFYKASPVPQFTSEPTVSPDASSTPNSNVPAGWSTYSNSQYNFEISYPSTYQALDSENDLYGWPDAIMLFYKGGQSYDIVIEVWDTEAEYQSKYSNLDFNVEVKEVEDKFLTITDMTKELENAQIISTFEFTN